MTGTLVVVCGTPGVGKTTVARAAADEVGGRLVRTDVVRKELFDDPDYTDEEERRVYDELFDRARTRVAEDGAVVLDGTFYREQYRAHAQRVAEDIDARFTLVRVDCDADTVRRRIAAREDDESDADFEVHEMYRDLFEPLQRDHLRVDNSGSEAEAHEQVAQHFEAVPAE